MKTVASGYDRIRPPAAGVVVLAYHRVGGGSGLEIDLDPGRFDEQMAWLASATRLVDLDRAVRELDRADGPPTVVVTFDDGTADFVDHALPVLVRHRVPVTYYVATRFVEEQRSFPDGGRPLTWAALGEAVSTGLVTIGSHTHNHAVMDKLDPSGAEDELGRAAGLIETRLGCPADHFAYPKGVYGGDAVGRVVARHCRSAALAGSTVNRYGATDPQRLDRTPVQVADRTRWFRAKAAGGLRLEGGLRGGLNRRRYGTARS
ncbi:MAG: polysaccharide deacetylase family protein [Acidimicrobiales bacterium]